MCDWNCEKYLLYVRRNPYLLRYDDIFNHRGWIDEETGELFGNRWGIRNNSTGEGEEFDIFGEFKCYFEKNYAKFGFILNQ